MREERFRRGSAAVAGVLAGALLAHAAASGDVHQHRVPREVDGQLREAVAGFFGSHLAISRKHARVLARSRDATLYGISDRRGDYCVELLGATRGLSYGFSCRAGIQLGARSVTGGEVDSPVTSIVVGHAVPPVLHFGRLATGTVAARALFADGSRQTIPIGVGGFFVYEPSAARMGVSRRGPTVIQLLEPGGSALTYQLLPEQPVTSTGRHFDRIGGHVVIDGAAAVRIIVGINAGRGRSIDLPLVPGGRFSWSGRSLAPAQVPALVVLDAHKRPLTNVVTPLPEPTWRRYLAAARGR